MVRTNMIFCLQKGQFMHIKKFTFPSFIVKKLQMYKVWGHFYYIFTTCAYTFRAKKTCQKLKSSLHMNFSQKSLPRTPTPTSNVWRGYKGLLESVLKICKSWSLPKLYTVKKQRLQKNEVKKTHYNNILKKQN